MSFPGKATTLASVTQVASVAPDPFIQPRLTIWRVTPKTAARQLYGRRDGTIRQLACINTIHLGSGRLVHFSLEVTNGLGNA